MTKKNAWLKLVNYFVLNLTPPKGSCVKKMEKDFKNLVFEKRRAATTPATTRITIAKTTTTCASISQ